MIGRRDSTHRGWRIGFAAVLLALTPALRAADWSIAPSVDAAAVYDSNAAFVNDDEKDGVSGELNVQFALERKTEVTQAWFRSIVGITRYEDDDLQNLDNERYSFDLGFGTEAERSDYGVRARYEVRPTFLSELDAAIPDDPDDPNPDGGGNINNRRDEQRLWNIEPSFSYLLSERNAIQLRGKYLDSSYDSSGDPSSTGRNDFSDASVELAWDHALSRRLGIIIGARGGEFTSDSENTDAENETVYYGGIAGLRWEVSEGSTVTVNAGVARSDVTIDSRELCTTQEEILAGGPCSVDDSSNSFIGELSWRKRVRRTRINFKAGRRLSPTSVGVQQVRDQVRLYVDRKITERFRGTVGLVAYTQEPTSGDVGVNRDYAQGELVGEWLIARNVAFTAGYRYVWRQSENLNAISEEEDFDSHTLRVGITWARKGVR